MTLGTYDPIFVNNTLFLFKKDAKLVSIETKYVFLSIRKIIAVWDDKNYWLKKDPGWKMKNNLQLGNEKHWIKFVCDVKKNDVSHTILVPLH